LVRLLLCQLWQLFGGIYTFLLALWGSSHINLNKYGPWAGRSMVQFPCIHSIATLVSFQCQPDFQFIPVVTGASTSHHQTLTSSHPHILTSPHSHIPTSSYPHPSHPLSSRPHFLTSQHTHIPTPSVE